MADARRAGAASAGVSSVAGLWSAVRRRFQARDQSLEFLSVLLLSLAALISAWCAYRASWWASEQSSYTITMSRAQGRAAVLENTAVQLTAFDAGMFIQYAEAYLNGEPEVVEFLRQRFRPEMRTAVEAWLTAEPLTNPDAPSSPFVLPEYSVSEGVQAAALRSQAQQAEENARQSNDRSTQFVAFTAMSALALFLGGISTKVPGLKWRARLLSVAWVVLLGTIGYIITFSMSVEPLTGLTPLPH